MALLHPPHLGNEILGIQVKAVGSVKLGFAIENTVIGKNKIKYRCMVLDY